MTSLPDLSVPRPLRDFLQASTIALALAEPEGDHPLIFVNPRFTQLTGYTPDDILGRNCRLLQREVSDGQAHAKFRAFLDMDEGRPVRAPVINFRKDGSPFVNLITMSRLRARTGETRFILASQFNVSRVHPERLRAYDRDLAATLVGLAPIAIDQGIAVDRTLETIADAVSTIAQAELTLANLGDDAASLT